VRKVLKDGARDATTFVAFAQAEADQPRGRFGAIDQNKIVVGSTAQQDYPPAAPHHTDPTGIEPPLNYDTAAVEPTGTANEIAPLHPKRRKR
jgi:hypothetical protein